MRKQLIKRHQIGGMVQGIGQAVEGLANMSKIMSGPSDWEIKKQKRKQEALQRRINAGGAQSIQTTQPIDNNLSAPQLTSNFSDEKSNEKLRNAADQAAIGVLNYRQQQREAQKQAIIQAAANKANRSQEELTNIAMSQPIENSILNQQPVGFNDPNIEDMMNDPDNPLNPTNMFQIAINQRLKEKQDIATKNGKPISAKNGTKLDKVMRLRKHQLGGAFGTTISGLGSNGLSGMTNTINGITGGINNALGPASEYSGKKGNITQSMDTAYDAIQQAASNFGPLGNVISVGMGANKMLGNVAKKLGAGTDGMTTQDAIMGSAFMQMTPLGLINGIFGRKSAELVNLENQTDMLYGSGMTSGFGGTKDQVTDAESYSNKKYGLLSQSNRKIVDNAINKLNMQQLQIQDIAAASKNAFDIQNSMTDTFQKANLFDMGGGYKQGAVHVGKQGFKFTKPIEIIMLEEPDDDLEDISFFKNGGQMNVIPEGALHANLHHMENGDKLTKKGIPVVDNDGNQQAEIERNEVILNLELTQKLEELYKKYYNDNTSKKEKDELALEAGKLLTEELLENTDDRTGLIDTVK